MKEERPHAQAVLRLALFEPVSGSHAGLRSYRWLSGITDTPLKPCTYAVPTWGSSVNAGTNQVVQTIQVGSDPTEVAAGAGAVWVANTGDGTVSRIDPRSGAVNKAIAVGPSPDGLAVGDASSGWP